jgi:hypothetical protein
MEQRMVEMEQRVVEMEAAEAEARRAGEQHRLESERLAAVLRSVERREAAAAEQRVWSTSAQLIVGSRGEGVRELRDDCVGAREPSKWEGFRFRRETTEPGVALTKTPPAKHTSSHRSWAKQYSGD